MQATHKSSHTQVSLADLEEKEDSINKYIVEISELYNAAAFIHVDILVSVISFSGT